MPTLELKGDFNAISTVLQHVKDVKNASFSSTTVTLNDLSAPNNTSFASGFDGFFQPSANTGTILSVEMDLFNFSPFELVIIVKFGGLLIPFSDVFNVTSSTFSYDETGWLPVAQTGDYTVTGSDIDDTLVSAGGFLFAGNDLVNAGGGNDRISGGLGRDKLFGEGGDDILNGNKGKDKLVGGFGADTLKGGAGNDKLIGSKGADLLFGGSGNDRLDGGKGKDTLTGGIGADVFVFGTDSKTDRITDFKIGADRIDTFSAKVFDSLRLKNKDGGTLVVDDGHKLFLEGVDPGDLSDSDFLF